MRSLPQGGSRGLRDLLSTKGGLFAQSLSFLLSTIDFAFIADQL
jgi:hypothetical protein